MSCISLFPFKDFSFQMEAAGCYCEYGETILFLKRSPDKPYGNTWGIPGGKLKEVETPQEATIREVEEETGINIPKQDLKSITKFYIRGLQMNYVFYTFCARFQTRPIISLALEEHSEARWVTIDEALKLPLIEGGVEALLHYREYRTSREKKTT